MRRVHRGRSRLWKSGTVAIGDAEWRAAAFAHTATERTAFSGATALGRIHTRLTHAPRTRGTDGERLDVGRLQQYPRFGLCRGYSLGRARSHRWRIDVTRHSHRGGSE